MLVRVQPGQPILKCLAQLTERDASNIEDAGETPPASAIFQGVMSVADGLAWNEEDGSAILSTPDHFGYLRHKHALARSANN